MRLEFLNLEMLSIKLQSIILCVTDSEQFMSNKAKNRTISHEDPCYIIAEAGVNHNGDIG